MKKKLISILFVMLLTAVALSACSGQSFAASGWAGVNADADTAYVAFNNFVYAVDLANGTERWHFPQELDRNITFFSAPQLSADGQLIVGGYDGVLYSLNPQNGQVNWTFAEAKGRYIGSPLVTSEGIFAPNDDKSLYAVDLSGNPLWAVPFTANDPNWSQPATNEVCDCIYLASMDHEIYAIEPATGNLLWQTEDLGGAIVGTPTSSADGQLYTGTFLNQMNGIDAANGKILWQFPTENWVWAGPAIDGDTLYFGDLSGKFYALDRQSGASLWQVQPGGAIVGTPLITADGIYFTTEDGSLVSVTPEGAIQFNQNFGSPLYTAPVAAGEMILISASNPEQLLIAVGSNGVQRWVFSPEK